MSQGYRGVNAAGKFPVRGILKFPSPDLDDQLLYLSLSEAQYFYGAMGMATSLVIDVADQDALYQVVHTLNSQLDTSYYAVLDWKKMMPELIEAQALDSAGNLIVYLLLYVIIAFGIFGTILMMTKERKYEFGILTAIGMRRSRLGFVIWLETVLLGILGALGGIMVSIPVVLYLKHSPLTFTGDYAVLLEKFGFEPIFPTLWDPTIFVTQAFLVFGVTAILGLFPVWKIRRLQPVKAMRS
ncbi:MAG: FtsX-like permease family protein [Saprospiraceae bacterium]|nr:FtsX-like permease family protein [Saprospiraceae bacterium]